MVKMRKSKPFSKLIPPILKRTKPNVTRQNRHDDYYGNIYFNKKIIDGIEFIARTEHKSKKQVAEELISIGIMNKINDYLDDFIHSPDNNSRQVPQRIVDLRKYGKLNGTDITKYTLVLRRSKKVQQRSENASNDAGNDTGQNGTDVSKFLRRKMPPKLKPDITEENKSESSPDINK